MKPSHKYQTPDPRWDIIGTKSVEEFIGNYVVPGQFLSIVPESIVEEYRNIEHIQFQSYFHYPLYDEALGAALRIMEMVVKNRCIQLQLPIEFKTRKGKMAPEKLSRMVERLKKKEPEKNYYKRFNSILYLRNHKSHPGENQSYGLGRPSGFMNIVNVINDVFLDHSVFQLLNSRKQIIVNQLEQSTAEVWKYPQREGNRFIPLKDIQFLGCYPTSENESISLFAFYPYSKAQTKEDQIVKPITKAFRGIEFIEGSIKLQTLNNENLILAPMEKKLSRAIDYYLAKKPHVDKEGENIRSFVKEAVISHELGEFVTKTRYLSWKKA